MTYPFLRSGERSEKNAGIQSKQKQRLYSHSKQCFQSRKLSAKAKGILVEMLSLPENWDYTLKGLTTFILECSYMLQSTAWL